MDHAFGSDVDYAMQQWQFGGATVNKSAAGRYSPAKITSITTKVINWEVSDLVALLEAAESKKAASLSRGWI